MPGDKGISLFKGSPKACANPMTYEWPVYPLPGRWRVLDLNWHLVFVGMLMLI